MSCLSWCTQFLSIIHGEREHLQSDSFQSKIDSSSLKDQFLSTDSDEPLHDESDMTVHFEH